MTATRLPVLLIWLVLALAWMPLTGWGQIGLRVSVVEQQAPRCADQSDGRVVLWASGGLPPYRFQHLPGDSLQEHGVFQQLPAGQHTFMVYDAGGQSVAALVLLAPVSPLQLQIQVSSPSSCGSSSGSIDIRHVAGGHPPYAFAFNGQPPTRSTRFSNLLPGSYTLGVVDALRCQHWQVVVVPPADSIRVSIQAIDYPSRCDRADGRVVLAPPAGGTPPYLFRVEPQSWQNGLTFDALPVGLHRFQVQDANGCLWQQTLSLERERPHVRLEVIRPLAGCSDTATADLGITVLSGQGLAGWRVGDGQWQTSTAARDLRPGLYLFQFIDSVGCTSNREYNLTTLVAYTTQVQVLQRPSCPNGTNGRVRIHLRPGPDTHFPPYRFSRDSLTWQSSPDLDGLTPGQHPYWVQDGRGCVRRFAADVPASDSLALRLTLANDPMTCGEDRAALRWMVQGGMPPYQYSLDGLSWTSRPEPDSVQRGEYRGFVRDARGCIHQSAPHRVQPFLELKVRVLSYPTCSDRRAVGAIHLTTNFGSGGMRFSIDGGTTYSPDSIYRNLAPRRYRLLVYDPIRQCGDSLHLDLSQVPVYTPSIDLNLGDCQGQSASVNIQIYPDSLQLLLQLSPLPLFSRGTKMIRQNLQPGRYSLQVIDPQHLCPLQLVDSNQQLTDSIEVVVQAPLQYALRAVPPSSCTALDGRIELEAPIPGYRLGLDGGRADSSVLANLPADSYRVYIQNQSGCVIYESIDLNVRPFRVHDSIRPTTSRLASDGWARLLMAGDYELPFRISWQDEIIVCADSYYDFLNLPAGTYRGWVEDARGCRVDYQIQILSPRQFSLSGRVFADYNRNGRFDADERPLPDLWISLGDEPDIRLAMTDAQGYYRLPVTTPGTYRVRCLAPRSFERIAPDSMGHQVRIADVFQLPDTLDFALLDEPDTTSDWGVVLTQRNPAKPGQLVEYVASLARTGPDSRPHNLQLDFDSRLTFQQITGGAIGRLQPSSLELEPVRLERPSVFDPRENRTLRFRLPDNPALAGTFLDARLHLLDPDNDPSNNESRERRRIVRDAQVTRKIVRSNTLVAADTVYESDVLDYIIYFQNTGRGPVRNVVVEDVLSPHLDVTTLQTVAASHPYQLMWGDAAPHTDGQGRRLSWRFPNIQLPDSVADPLESIGFVRFRIRPRSGMACETAIHNEVLLHFDNQPPYRTPAVRTVVNPLPAAVVFALRDTLFVGETNRLNLVNQRHVSRAGTWDFDSDATPTGSMGAGPFDVSWSSPGLKHVRVPLANAYCAAEAETQIQVNWRCPSADLQFIAPDTVYVGVPFEVQAAGRSVPGLRMTLGSHPSLVGPTILWPNQPAMLQVQQAGTLVLRITTVENDSCRYDLEHTLYAVNCPLPTQPPLASTAPCVGVEEIIVHSSAWGTKYLFFPSLDKEYRFRPDAELERKAEAEGEAVRNLELELIDTATNCRHNVVYPIRLRSCTYKLPEVFTPNGDGINDQWGANPELWQTVRLRVFDRNGRLVFSSNQVQEHWDGTHAGRAVQEGAFHYVAEGQLQNGQQVRLSGRVTLLR